MDMETCLPLLYPLRYHIDHLAHRSLSTQSASLQAVKFFYEFWQQKYGVTFCYSFYSSGHNPDIAVREMPSFSLYLENGRVIQSSLLPLSTVSASHGSTNAARFQAVIHFISFLINTYISPAYRDDSPKALSLLASRLHIRLHLCRDNYRTLIPGKSSQCSHNGQGFQSLTYAMVVSLYGIIAPSSPQKHNPLNPFPFGYLQFRNFLIVRLLLNYGLRIGELLLLECSSIKSNIKGNKFSLIVTTVEGVYDPRKNAPSLKNVWANRVLELDKQDYSFLSIYIEKFADIAAAFEEIRDAEGPVQASAMVERHAVLYPLKFGSCMREVNLWGCPYRLKCQSAVFCEHFTLTGRIDELPNLIAKKQALQQARSKLIQLAQPQPDCQAKLADIDQRLQQLDARQTQWLRRAETQQLVATENVLSADINTEGEIRTLAQLFALEYQQLIQETD
ncbi:hypothetical protein [Enterobacter asburiae]|uniref:hypothetical protein n=1 Tax=Enterobacter asburiae TaxID=61645 RepID=UPI0021CB0597|nr:hypothetical protein [Enterobacter asburiae]